MSAYWTQSFRQRPGLLATDISLPTVMRKEMTCSFQGILCISGGKIGEEGVVLLMGMDKAGDQANASG